jgi:hypothetical protein
MSGSSFSGVVPPKLLVRFLIRFVLSFGGCRYEADMAELRRRQSISLRRLRRVLVLSGCAAGRW